ncbi:DUF2793 domain-containing protein [Bosea sp. PAMC 26642]|uniref:DUF2793 domain-containing protein n=1 Tax=Bosea sp. (strain PAMC 26642) TaxID=1792307 RepID=UPI00077047E8|nr:DUF2793 domain-containing protein [Bosea sp. PAMC 26642]AMJ61027.1 hypothetical protein AXW83_12645 [Bosea sp. PAMC 26642]
MTATARLDLPLLAAGQAQKHVTHNDALIRLDALVHLSVTSRTETGPPAVPSETSAYIVPAAATGVFAGHEDEVALFEDGGWSFLEPRPGWQAWVADEAEEQIWTGTIWRRASPISSEGAELWGVNATADAANRLAVASPASLFNHDGAGHRLTINKAAAGQTASFVLQDGFSGRAEIGLAGDDDLHLKVSADGSSWTEALMVDRSNGQVSLPATPWAAQPNLLVNGDMTINQRGFSGGALGSGAYGFDRWKADAAGTSLSVSGFSITLSSGAIVQIVEPLLWGIASFAGVPLTLSVEGLSGGNLTVGIGSVSGAITAGSGRRSVTLTPAVGDTVRLAPAAGAVAFQRIKLEFGRHATPWQARPLPQEQALARRYHWRVEGTYLFDGYQAAGQAVTELIVLPTSMRAVPSASFSVVSQGNINGGGTDRGIDTLTAGSARMRMAAAATGRVFAEFSDIVFDAEL